MYPDFLGNWEVIQENYKWFRVTLTFKKEKGEVPAMGCPANELDTLFLPLSDLSRHHFIFSFFIGIH